MLSILIASDVRLYSECLSNYLTQRSSMTVKGFATNRVEVLGRVTALKVELVLLDMSMAGALDLGRDLLAAQVRVIALGCPDEEAVLVACSGMGVHGYVSRAATIDDLDRAIAGAIRDERYCDEGVAAFALRCVGEIAARQRRSDRESSRASLSALTRREDQVARLMGEGLSNKDIARRLCVEVSTVKNHVHNVLSKLGARNRCEAAFVLSRGMSDRLSASSVDPSQTQGKLPGRQGRFELEQRGY